MDIFHNGYYKYNKLLLFVFGIWPFYESRSSETLIFGFVVFLNITAIPPQFLGMKESWPDLSSLLECMPAFGCQWITIVKLLNTKYHQTTISALMKHIAKDWKRFEKEDERLILTKYAIAGRNATIFYWIYISSSTVAFTLLPLTPKLLDIVTPLNESRRLEPLLQFSYMVDPNKYYYPIYAHSVIEAHLCMTIDVAVDAMVAILVYHPCSMFALLRYRLRNITLETRKADVNVPIHLDKAYWTIRECIRLQQSTLVYCETIMSAHTTSYFMQVLINTFVISCIGLQTTLRMNTVPSTIRYSLYTVGTILHLFFNCIPGQLLVDHSLAIRRAIYADALWYKLSPRSRRLLLFMMMRAGVPCEMRAGKFFVMCMETFANVFKMSVSYFTMLTSIN